MKKAKSAIAEPEGQPDGLRRYDEDDVEGHAARRFTEDDDRILPSTARRAVPSDGADLAPAGMNKH